MNRRLVAAFKCGMFDIIALSENDSASKLSVIEAMCSVLQSGDYEYGVIFREYVTAEALIKSKYPDGLIGIEDIEGFVYRGRNNRANILEN